MTDFDLNFAYAYGEPAERAMLKGQNAHFLVDEALGFEPDGDGEHYYIHVQSDGDNTQWLAEQMAKAVGLRAVDVGFCGLKDRNAITRQWFSIYDPKRELETKRDLLAAALPNSQLLRVARGAAKLRRGQHAGNGFVITLVFDGTPQVVVLEQRLAQIQAFGVPNYFGLQRFGRNGNNLNTFDSWLQNKAAGKRQRKPKGIVLSAARSYLFNRVLAGRVVSGSWVSELSGDVIEQGVPTGVLWGRGRSATQGEALMAEVEALADLGAWSDALEHLGLQQERRTLVCQPSEFAWSWQSANNLRLTFSLLPGQYATSVIRELCATYEPDRRRAERTD